MARLCPTVATVLLACAAVWPGTHATRQQPPPAPLPIAFTLAEPDPAELFPIGWWAAADKNRLVPAFEPVQSSLWWLPEPEATVPLLALRQPGVLSMPATTADASNLVVAAYQETPEEATVTLLAVSLSEDDEPAKLLYRQPVGHADLDLNLFAAQAVTIAPHGRYYTLPSVQPPGTAVVRADGTLLTIYRNAFDPSWSPDGRYLVMRQEGPTGSGIRIVTPDEPGPGRLIAEQPSHQPAVWSRTPRLFWQLIWHRRQQANRFIMTPVLALCSTQVEATRMVHTLWPLWLPEKQARDSVWFITRPSRERVTVLVCGTDGTGSIWVWDSSSRRPMQRVVQLPIPLVRRAPTLRADGSFLAWVGSAPGVPLLWHRGSWIDAYSPLLPTAAAKLVLLHGAAARVQGLLHGAPAQRARSLTPLLPWPWPSATGSELTRRPEPSRWQTARHLAREALALAGTIPEAALAPAARRGLLEAIMFLSYVAGAYDRALAAADALDSLEPPTERERLILVRLYCLAGAGRYQQALAALESLTELVGDSPRSGPNKNADRSVQMSPQLRTWLLGDEMDQALTRIEQRLHQALTAD